MPLICKHPEVANLVVAGGGSYNHAKDAPGIGRRILDAVKGPGDPACGWNSTSSSTSGVQAHLMTQSNFPDLEQEAARDGAVQQIYGKPISIL